MSESATGRSTTAATRSLTTSTSPIPTPAGTTATATTATRLTTTSFWGSAATPTPGLLSSWSVGVVVWMRVVLPGFCWQSLAKWPGCRHRKQVMALLGLSSTPCPCLFCVPPCVRPSGHADTPHECASLRSRSYGGCVGKEVLVDGFGCFLWLLELDKGVDLLMFLVPADGYREEAAEFGKDFAQVGFGLAVGDLSAGKGTAGSRLLTYSRVWLEGGSAKRGGSTGADCGWGSYSIIIIVGLLRCDGQVGQK